jgi:hypothetical protein
MTEFRNNFLIYSVAIKYLILYNVWVEIILFIKQASYPGALSLGVKRPEHEAYHSPPSSAEASNAWSYTSTPQYAFKA